MSFQSRRFIVVAMVMATVAISLYLPFHLDTPTIEKLNVGTAFISAISTVITLLIALYLFNRFGLENEVLTKKATVVFELMSELRKLGFFMTARHGGFVQYFPSASLYPQHRDLLKSWMNYELLFTSRYSEKVQKISDLMNDVFMPLEIREKLLPLCQISVIASTPMTDNHLCIGMSPMVYKVGATGDENNSKNEERLRSEPYGLLNKKVITFSEFAQQWQSAIEAAKSWLKQHSLHHEVNL